MKPNYSTGGRPGAVRQALFGCAALIALLSGSGHLAHGQTASPATIEATVVGDLTVIREQDLRFGEVMVGSGEHVVLASDANAGRFRVTGSVNASVRLTVADRPDRLTREGGADGEPTIPLALVIEYARGQGNTATCPAPAHVLSGTSADLRLRCNMTDNPGQPRGATADAFVWLSGSIDVGDVPPGLYSATVVLEAEYP